MSKTWQFILTLLSLVISIAGYSLWTLMWKGFFYHCLAVSMVLWWILIRDLTNGRIRTVATIGIWLALSNVADELFFDPKAIQWNEYIFAIIVTIVIIRRCQKN